MSTEDPSTKVLENSDSPPNSSNFLHLSTNQRYGLNIEQWVIKKLESLGYSPKVPTNFSEKACDSVVNGLCVEIKGAKRTKRTRVLSSGEVKTYYRYQWSFNEKPTGEFAAILVADTPGKKRICFVVPGSQVGDRTHLQITSHPLKYSGWLAQYLEKWDVIDFLASQVYLNGGPLFEQWEREGERVAA